jgi:hypothetical protein
MCEAMTTIIASVASGVITALIYGYFILKQIASSERAHRELMERLKDERNMMNERLKQILSNTSNIATAVQSSAGNR